MADRDAGRLALPLGSGRTDLSLPQVLTLRETGLPHPTALSQATVSDDLLSFSESGLRAIVYGGVETVMPIVRTGFPVEAR